MRLPAIGDDRNGGHDDHHNTASRFLSPGKPPMKGKRKLLRVVAGAVLLAFLCFSWFQSHQSYLRWAGAYARVQLGMTRAEVTEAIGLPPGYHEGRRPMPPSMSRFVRTPPLKQAGLAYEDLDGAERKMLEVWVGRDFVIWVLFGEDGAAVGSYLPRLQICGWGGYR
jgi:hypothetical protein